MEGNRVCAHSSVQNSGVFPLGHPSPVDLMESSGIYNQNQLISNVNAKVNSGLTLFGFYVFNRARSNTDGIGTFPANPYNLADEYGPASTDVHHRVTVGGSINLKWAVRISPFVVLQSGAPFDINAGRRARPLMPASPPGSSRRAEGFR